MFSVEMELLFFFWIYKDELLLNFDLWKPLICDLERLSYFVEHCLHGMSLQLLVELLDWLYSESVVSYTL